MDRRDRLDSRCRTAKDALYILFESDDAGLNADPAPPKNVDRPKLYGEDCVELFVGTDAKEPRRYYEIELGPLGHFLDLSIDRTVTPTKGDVAWSSGVVVATKTDAVGEEPPAAAELTPHALHSPAGFARRRPKHAHVSSHFCAGTQRARDRAGRSPHARAQEPSPRCREPACDGGDLRSVLE